MTNPELAVIQVPYSPKSALNGSHSIRNVLIVHSICVPCLALCLGADTRPTPPPPAVLWSPEEMPMVPAQNRLVLLDEPERAQGGNGGSTFWRGIAGRRKRRAA